jgi:hypothetical protein
MYIKIKKGTTIMDNGIKSKERVKNFGEVFTPDTIVNDMLDLVSEQLPEDESYITKTFLEPSCGDGQFLIRILYRKLLQVQKLPLEKRQFALVEAVSSIYGIDIQQDNVNESRRRMMSIILGNKETSFDLNDKPDAEIQIDIGIDMTDQLKSVIDYILTTNIKVGNTIDNNDFVHNTNGAVELIAYHFNDTNGKVSLARASLNNLDAEYDQTDEVDILDIVNIEFNDDNYDF